MFIVNSSINENQKLPLIPFPSERPNYERAFIDETNFQI